MNERLAHQRAAQGFPPTVEDPVILARVAALVLGDGEGAAEATPRTTTRQSNPAGTTRPAHKGATPDGTPLGT